MSVLARETPWRSVYNYLGNPFEKLHNVMFWEINEEQEFGMAAALIMWMTSCGILCASITNSWVGNRLVDCGRYPLCLASCSPQKVCRWKPLITVTLLYYAFHCAYIFFFMHYSFTFHNCCYYLRYSKQYSFYWPWRKYLTSLNIYMALFRFTSFCEVENKHGCLRTVQLLITARMKKKMPPSRR